MTAMQEIPVEVRVESGVVRNGFPGQRLFSTKEYQQMAESGVLNEDERVELIEGRIVRMPPKNVKHALATTRANRCFGKLLGDRSTTLFCSSSLGTPSKWMIR